VFAGIRTLKLLVVRHGQTQLNAEQRYLGALDPALNDVGIRQAEDLVHSLPHNFDHIICSPLLRAKQTAEIICSLLDKKPIYVAAFRERNVGVYEGLTQEEARAQFPELWRRNITRQWYEAPPGGETIAEVFERVDAGLNDLAKKYSNDTVLLIAHGFVAKICTNS